MTNETTENETHAELSAQIEPVVSVPDTEPSGSRQKPVVSCQHSITRGRKGEKGLWCIACGEKAYGVDDRQCADCKHSKEQLGSVIMTCSKKLMGVLPDMNVTYKVAEGSCWKGN